MEKYHHPLTSSPRLRPILAAALMGLLHTSTPSWAQAAQAVQTGLPAAEQTAAAPSAPSAQPEDATSAPNTAAHSDTSSPDGGTYFGPLRHGKRHGQGRMEWPNGQRYEGGFADGLFHGQGRLEYPSGYTYEGQFLQGMAHGQGRATWPTGNRYEGQFVRDLMHGQGVYHFDNHVYRGEFVGDRMQGEGALEIPYLGTVSGQFEQDKPVGQVVLTHLNGNRYEGKMRDWELRGPGRIILPDGTVIEGRIEDYEINGRGRIRFPDGSRYSGDLVHSQPNGNGRMRYANGDEYRGEFIGGAPYGEGTLRYAKAKPNGQRSVRGLWVDGQLHLPEQRTDKKSKTASDAAPDTPAQWQANINTVLYNQSALLSRAFAQLAPQRPGQSDLYALLVAGDGTQEVFRREVRYAQNLLDSRYGTAGRSIALINSRTGVEQTPLATEHSLRASLQALAKVMDREEDVLLLFLTSHGSATHELSLQMHGIELSDLPAQTLADALRESGIRRRIVIVSACYSGGFIEPLRDEHTLIITAARADRTSFGCADDNDFTYFGRALFQEALSKQPPSSLSDAFVHASALVRQWEDKRDTSTLHISVPGKESPEDPQASSPQSFSEPQMAASAQWRQWVDAQWLRWQTPNQPAPKISHTGSATQKANAQASLQTARQP